MISKKRTRGGQEDRSRRRGGEPEKRRGPG